MPSVPGCADRHIVLVGMMGSGKTTIGRRLAALLDRPFLDSDTEVEARTGRTVRELFEHQGEPTFRAVESEVLADALASPTPAVIAAAGGVVLAEANRRRLADSGAEVIWLKVDTDVLARRVGRTAATGHRPLLAEDPAGVLARMAIDRTPLYEAVATHVLAVGDARIADVVDAVTRLVAP